MYINKNELYTNEVYNNEVDLYVTDLHEKLDEVIIRLINFKSNKKELELQFDNYDSLTTENNIYEANNYIQTLVDGLVIESNVLLFGNYGKEDASISALLNNIFTDDNFVYLKSFIYKNIKNSFNVNRDTNGEVSKLISNINNRIDVLKYFIDNDMKGKNYDYKTAINYLKNLQSGRESHFEYDVKINNKSNGELLSCLHIIITKFDEIVESLFYILNFYEIFYG